MKRSAGLALKIFCIGLVAWLWLHIAVAESGQMPLGAYHHIQPDRSTVGDVLGRAGEPDVVHSTGWSTIERWYYMSESGVDYQNIITEIVFDNGRVIAKTRRTLQRF